MRKEYGLGPLVTDSSTLAPSEVNTNTELYMRIWSQNLTTLLSLFIKRTSSSCGVVGRFGNRTLPFSQHRENCGLLFVDFADRSLIHIFALQNPHIVSISPQSHCLGVDASLFPNNCNASLGKEGCSRCLARRFFYRRLWRSCADSDVPWLNCIRTLICGTRFSKESVCSSFRWASRCCRRAVKAAKALPCCAMSARICSYMSSSILGRGGSPALFCANAMCVDIVEVWLHQLKNCTGSAIGVKIWSKINPLGGGGNESPWFISLYSLICSMRYWFL